MILQTEENYSKLLKENEELTKEAANKVLKENNKLTIEVKPRNSNNMNNVNNMLVGNNNINSLNISNNPNINTIRRNSNTSLNLVAEDTQKINYEYMKNIILKYLDATAVGNEFQIKILESVIFSMLKIPDSEKNKLEEKRLRSSFYYNLWYNARDFLSSKIYGSSTGRETGESNLGMQEHTKVDN